MGILTDFFVANDQQLAAVFTGWRRVADEPVERQIKNPFTGQMQIAREWLPLKPVGEGELADIPNIRQLPHAEWKGIDPVKLATLNELLTGKSVSEAVDDLMKPAVVHPTNDETSLHEVPRSLTVAIQALSDDDLQNVAVKWQQTEEMQSDRFPVEMCADVLQSLRRLVTAIEPDQRTYLHWSL
jgi:hypothetical protein